MRNPEQFGQFLDLEKSIQNELPPSADIWTQTYERLIEIRHRNKQFDQPKNVLMEPAFVSRFVTPAIRNHLVDQYELPPGAASDSIISENRIDKDRGNAHREGITAYPQQHPFSKLLGKSAADIANGWKTDSNPVSTQHPDLCLRKPFPILVEAKFFQKGQIDAARTAIAETVYQSFFYLGLARRVDAPIPWDYEFACALIYDATGSAIREAWTKLDERIRLSIWDAANVFVLIVTGADADNHDSLHQRP